MIDALAHGISPQSEDFIEAISEVAAKKRGLLDYFAKINGTTRVWGLAFRLRLMQ